MFFMFVVPVSSFLGGGRFFLKVNGDGDGDGRHTAYHSLHSSSLLLGLLPLYNHQKSLFLF